MKALYININSGSREANPQTRRPTDQRQHTICDLCDHDCHSRIQWSPQPQQALLKPSRKSGYLGTLRASGRPKRGNWESCGGKNVRARLGSFHLNWQEPIHFFLIKNTLNKNSVAQIARKIRTN